MEGQSKEAVWKEPLPALLESSFPDERSLRKLKFLVGGANHSWGSTELLLTSDAPESNTEIPIFLNFLAIGLVTPFYPFFMAILEHFQIHALHLHPNAMLVLAIFSQLCEGFVGVRLSLELFCHFFSVRRCLGNQTSGCVTFRLTGEEASADFISLNPRESLSEWHQNWMLVDALRESDWLRAPAALAREHD